ncbi:MAG: heparinase II/III family protein, partial [Clostridia bacterium]
KIASDIEAVIKKNGVLNLGSDMLPGYGFAALRDGKLSGDTNTQRDFWMYFGRTNGHGHLDAGNIGIHAFGLDMAPDFGYPEATGVTDNRMQWVHNTISHNTVVVNSRGQDEKYDGNPLHFDDSGDVKVMDVAFNAYEEASIYRRSVVMVKVNDDVSYAVDFFHVKGGNDHIYTFHAQSDEIAKTEGLNLAAQATGTYAGTGVPWGPGAATGFSWLRGVSRAEKPGAYSVDFKIKDFRKVLPTDQNLHLRMTMLGSAALSDVAIADGTPPRVKG